MDYKFPQYFQLGQELELRADKMRVFDNGIYRDATPEEIAEWSHQEEFEYPPSLEDSLAAIEESFRKGLAL